MRKQRQLTHHHRKTEGIQCMNAQPLKRSYFCDGVTTSTSRSVLKQRRDDIGAWFELVCLSSQLFLFLSYLFLCNNFDNNIYIHRCLLSSIFHKYHHMVVCYVWYSDFQDSRHLHLGFILIVQSTVDQTLPTAT